MVTAVPGLDKNRHKICGTRQPRQGEEVDGLKKEKLCSWSTRWKHGVVLLATAAVASFSNMLTSSSNIQMVVAVAIDLVCKYNLYKRVQERSLFN